MSRYTVHGTDDDRSWYTFRPRTCVPTTKWVHGTDEDRSWYTFRRKTSVPTSSVPCTCTMYPLGSWYRGLRPVYRVPYANKFPAFGRVYRVLVPYAKKNSGLRPECVPTPAFGRGVYRVPCTHLEFVEFVEFEREKKQYHWSSLPFTPPLIVRPGNSKGG